ncbi:hypothetical protein GGR56DRAFT_664851 [Xylariaceae sp. FL0804]|nr:hypothetical protein GGR56DRAFT_664851 [Xylariaceae sp. FL0804]
MFPNRRGGPSGGGPPRGYPSPGVPIGRLITKLESDVISRDGPVHEARITDCTYAASYSLVDSQPAKILVPGQPALWAPRELPASLEGDRGQYLHDQDAARLPQHPLQPSVQAVLAMNLVPDTPDVDIMGCASSLGDILRFTRSVDATVQYDAEIVGKTLFLIRNRGSEIIPDVRGYGYSFLDAFTTYDSEVKETEPHQRIVSYRFADLKCVVRFDCDGYPPRDDCIPTSVATSRSPDLLQPSSFKLVDMYEAGRTVPQQSVIEIKTRAQEAGHKLDEQLPRLWLRQIPNLVTASHVRGRFDNVRVLDTREDILAWEDAHQEELRRFASVLRWLIRETKRATGSRLRICREGTGPLQLTEQCAAMWSRHRVDPVPHHWAEVLDGPADGSFPQGPGPSSNAIEEGYWTDDSASANYTACDATCGYCRHCS